MAETSALRTVFSMKLKRLPRDLRRYEQLRVLVTLDGGVGMRGFLEHVGPDHVALVDASAIVSGPEGPVIDPPTPGPHLLERSRIVRMQVLQS